MGWFDLFKKRRIRQFRVPSITWLCEQDGDPERVFKKALIEYFIKCDNVLNAYLVKARYPARSEDSVVLCYRLEGGNEREIVRNIGEIFRPLFSNTMHLDVLALDDRYEGEVMQICNPFYVRDQPGKRK